jgi:hypothetical protein
VIPFRAEALEKACVAESRADGVRRDPVGQPPSQLLTEKGICQFGVIVARIGTLLLWVWLVVFQLEIVKVDLTLFVQSRRHGHNSVKLNIHYF